VNGLLVIAGGLQQERFENEPYAMRPVESQGVWVCPSAKSEDRGKEVVPGSRYDAGRTFKVPLVLYLYVSQSRDMIALDKIRVTVT